MESKTNKGKITVDTTQKQRIIRECYEELYTSKLDDLQEMDKFSE